jgi:hypothetical protein
MLEEHPNICIMSSAIVFLVYLEETKIFLSQSLIFITLLIN